MDTNQRLDPRKIFKIHVLRSNNAIIFYISNNAFNLREKRAGTVVEMVSKLGTGYRSKYGNIDFVKYAAKLN